MNIKFLVEQPVCCIIIPREPCTPTDCMARTVILRLSVFRRVRLRSVDVGRV